MATWHVPDELDARLRRRLGGGDASEHVERLVADQLDYEEDAAYRASVDAQIRRSVHELEAGQGVDAREALREIAAKYGITLPR